MQLLQLFLYSSARFFSLQLDLVKTRQQCGTSEAIHRIVASVVAESGPMGLFAGLVRPTVEVSREHGSKGSQMFRDRMLQAQCMRRDCQCLYFC